MDYIIPFMKKINFPSEAVECISALYETVQKNEKLNAQFELLCDMYMFDADDINGYVMNKLALLAKENDVNEYTLVMLLLVVCSQKLKAKYDEKGISEEIFYRTMDDLRCKLLECIECEGVWGTFVGGWFHGFYVLNRFGLDRFQFEYSEVDDDYTMPDGTVIPADTKCVGMHIPSSGIPLTDDVRFESYKKAYEFFKDERYGDKLIIKCGSWLLYPAHRQFLPAHLNILKFMNDFDIISDAEKDGFSNDWRVFGHYSDLPYAELPEDTALRRAYKKHLLETGKAGDGFGYIVFDGENIVNKR